MGKVLESQKNVLNILNYLIKFKINTIYCITTYIKTHIYVVICVLCTCIYVNIYLHIWKGKERKVNYDIVTHTTKPM